MEIYRTQITKIGSEANNALQIGTMILFKQNLNTELEVYCFSHLPNTLKTLLKVGDILHLSDEQYPITAIGEVANQNLKELGHITLHFDGSLEASLPGNIHLRGKVPDQVAINTLLSIHRNS